ncbi:hypothetical protein BC834DRAFT_550488 [Gloeopeniophorella convolvens]|nr:hypothetical protein BC834DRAFT_672550 [Gloeopeniophorella convolvens]KAI0260270.1 hypothetical protein BC834DRAFT_550488 [Gloeopeniophorella convolvens]
MIRFSDVARRLSTYFESPFMRLVPIMCSCTHVSLQIPASLREVPRLPLPAAMAYPYGASEHGPQEPYPGGFIDPSVLQDGQGYYYPGDSGPAPDYYPPQAPTATAPTPHYYAPAHRSRYTTPPTSSSTLAFPDARPTGVASYAHTTGPPGSIHRSNTMPMPEGQSSLYESYGGPSAPNMTQSMSYSGGQSTPQYSDGPLYSVPETMENGEELDASSFHDVLHHKGPPTRPTIGRANPVAGKAKPHKHIVAVFGASSTMQAWARDMPSASPLRQCEAILRFLQHPALRVSFYFCSNADHGIVTYGILHRQAKLNNLIPLCPGCNSGYSRQDNAYCDDECERKSTRKSSRLFRPFGKR